MVEQLAARNIFAWSGTFYAWEAAGALDLRDGSGLCRIGLSHYTSAAEVERVVEALASVAAGKPARAP